MIHRWLKRKEVEYHHLPDSRQADSSRRLLALIVSRHAARARYPSPPPSQPHVTPLVVVCLTFLRHAASPRGSAPPPANGATNFRLRVGISSGTLDPIACAYHTQTAAGGTRWKFTWAWIDRGIRGFCASSVYICLFCCL